MPRELLIPSPNQGAFRAAMCPTAGPSGGRRAPLVGESACCGGGGACCLSGGTCEALSSDECVLRRGVYQGDGTSCAGRICTGACCISGTECLDMGFGPCVLNFAPTAFKGIGTVCSTGLCPGQCCDTPGTPCYWTSGGALSQTIIQYSVTTEFTIKICCGGAISTCTFTRSASGTLTLARTGCLDGTFSFNNLVSYTNTNPSCLPTPCGSFSGSRSFGLQFTKTGQAWTMYQALFDGTWSSYTNSCNFAPVFTGCLPSFTKTCTETGSEGTCSGSPLTSSAVSTWTITFLQGLAPCGQPPARPAGIDLIDDGTGQGTIVAPSPEEVHRLLRRVSPERAAEMLERRAIGTRKPRRRTYVPGVHIIGDMGLTWNPGAIQTGCQGCESAHGVGGERF